MTVTVAQMSKDELKERIATTVEQTLLELLGDPDEGLEMKVRAGKAATPTESHCGRGAWRAD